MQTSAHQVMALLTAAVIPIAGTVNAPVSTVLASAVSEDFAVANGALPSGWQVKSGAWSVMNQEAHVGNGTARAILPGVGVLPGTTMSADFTRSSAIPSWNGLVLSERSATDRWDVRIKTSESSTATWMLVRVAQDDHGQIQETPVGYATFPAPKLGVPFTLSTSHHVELDPDAISIHVLQGEDRLLDTSLPLPSDAQLAGGAPGVYSNTGNISVDNVHVTGSINDDFTREAPNGELASQNLAGNWTEALGRWATAEGTIAASRLSSVTKNSALLVRTSAITPGATEVRAAFERQQGTEWNGVAVGASLSSANRSPIVYYAFQVNGSNWRIVQVNSGRLPIVIEHGGIEGFDTTRSFVAHAEITAGDADGATFTLTQGKELHLRSVEAGNASTARTLTADTSGAPIVLEGRHDGIVTTTDGATLPVHTRVTGYRVTGSGIQNGAAPPTIEQTSGTWNTKWESNASWYDSPVNVSATPKSLGSPWTWSEGRNRADSSAPQALYTDFDRATNTPRAQYVGYYNVDGHLTVAQRIWDPAADRWSAGTTFVAGTGWTAGDDGHHRISLGLSPDGNVFVAGGMWFQNALRYYVTTTPGDITTLSQRTAMVPGDASTEQHVTYPGFFTNADESQLYFMYRDGGSGDGDWYINRYNPDVGSWERVTKLFERSASNGKSYSAYPTTNAPVVDEQGVFHLAWIWRSTERADSASHISYAQSSNLVDWADVSGAHVLGSAHHAIGYDDVAATVDPVPEGGGALNILVSMTVFDDGPMIAYTKLDDATEDAHGSGSSQFYIARFDRSTGEWVRTQLTNYVGRWLPQGYTPPMPFAVDTPYEKEGHILLPYVYGSHAGTFVLDPNTLEVVGESERARWASLVTPQPFTGAVTTLDSSGYRRVVDGSEYQYIMVFGSGTQNEMRVFTARR